MSYEKRDAVLTKVWRAVRGLNPDFNSPVFRDMIKEVVNSSLQSVEPGSETTIIGYVDGALRLRWSGSDEIIRIRREEGVMEVRVGL